MKEKNNSLVDVPKSKNYDKKDNIIPIWARLKSDGQNYSHIRHLASAAFPFSDKHKYMLMLSAYMDETGHYRDEKQKFVGIAGLIAPKENWETFEEKWKAALKLPYIKLEYFHMTDYASKKKVYKDWLEVKRQKVLGKLLNVIESAYPIPFGAIIPMNAFRSLSKEHQEYFIDPYFLCFQSIIAASTTFLEAMKIPEEEKIALIFSDQVEFRHRALKMYEDITEVGLFAHRSTPPIFRDIREIVPLQAADIVAYEMYKEFERRMYRPNDDSRHGFKRLEVMSRRTNFRNPTFRFFTKNDLVGYVNQYEQVYKLREYLENKLKKAS